MNGRIRSVVWCPETIAIVDTVDLAVRQANQHLWVAGHAEPGLEDDDSCTRALVNCPRTELPAGKEARQYLRVLRAGDVLAADDCAQNVSGRGFRPDSLRDDSDDTGNGSGSNEMGQTSADEF